MICLILMFLIGYLHAQFVQDVATQTCELSDARQFNDSCTDDMQCYGYPDLAKCVNKKCVCAPGYVSLPLSDDPSIKMCSKAPKLNEPCYDLCTRPLTCKDTGIIPQYDLFGNVIATNRICKCDAPYKLLQSNCYMDCKPNEKYDSATGKCVPKCRASEVLVNNKCKSMVSLRSQCVSSAQCQVPFSYCVNGICICQNGFTSQGSVCKQQTFICPSGSPLYRGTTLIQCRVSVTVDPLKAGYRRGIKPERHDEGRYHRHCSEYNIKDLSCPSNYFCLPPGSDTTKPRNATGYCCAKPNLNCPVGKPLMAGKCDVSKKDKAYCPAETHFCHYVSFGGREFSVCCPRMCPKSLVFVNGRCYPKAHVGDACSLKEQCADPNSICTSGFCRCPKGYVLNSTAMHQYCKPDCKQNQVEYGGNCYSALKLGASCLDAPWRCPKNAVCNRFDVCACKCTFIAMDDMYTCMTQPLCSSSGNSASSDNIGTFISTGTSDYTFCTIKDKPYTGELLSSVINTCPTNQYCSPHLSNLGVCCNTPEQLCPDGSEPIKSTVETPLNCDPSNPDICNMENVFCYKFITLANPTIPDMTGICCYNHQNNIIPS